jgi:hypothetical protein
MKILDNIVNNGKRLLVGITALTALSGCATTATYDVNQFCGTNPIENGTVVKAVKRVDDRGIEISYFKAEKDLEQFVKMDYDGDGMFEEQIYTKNHPDGSRTDVRCYNDGVFEAFGGRWKMEQFDLDSNGNVVKEDYQSAR